MTAGRLSVPQAISCVVARTIRTRSRAGSAHDRSKKWLSFAAVGASVVAAAEKASVDDDGWHRLDAPFGDQRRRGLVGAEVADDDLLVVAGHLAHEGLAGNAHRAPGTEDCDSSSHGVTVHIPAGRRVKRYRRSVRIAELAETVSVPAKTIRYYEAIGLLPTPRPAFQRVSLLRSLAGDRLRFVRAAQAVGSPSWRSRRS